MDPQPLRFPDRQRTASTRLCECTGFKRYSSGSATQQKFELPDQLRAFQFLNFKRRPSCCLCLKSAHDFDEDASSIVMR